MFRSSRLADFGDPLARSGYWLRSEKGNPPASKCRDAQSPSIFFSPVRTDNSPPYDANFSILLFASRSLFLQFFFLASFSHFIFHHFVPGPCYFPVTSTLIYFSSSPSSWVRVSYRNKSCGIEIHRSYPQRVEPRTVKK